MASRKPAVDRVGARADRHPVPEAGDHRPRDRCRDRPARAEVSASSRAVGSVGNDQIFWSRDEGVGGVRSGQYTASVRRTERRHVRSGRGPGLQSRPCRAPSAPTKGDRPSTSPWNAPRRSPGSSCFRTASRPRVSTSSSPLRPTRSCSRTDDSRARRALPDIRPGPTAGSRSPRANDKFLLIAWATPGYADASSAEFAKSDKLILQPWGRLEGELIVGRQPKPNEEISYTLLGPPRPGAPTRLFHQYATHTDDHGRFTFDRVMPGRGSVSHVLVTNLRPVLACN